MPTGLQHVYGVVGWQVYAMFVEGVRHPHAYRPTACIWSGRVAGICYAHRGSETSTCLQAYSMYYRVVGWQVHAMFIEGVRHAHACSMWCDSHPYWWELFLCCT